MLWNGVRDLNTKLTISASLKYYTLNTFISEWGYMMLLTDMLVYYGVKSHSTAVIMTRILEVFRITQKWYVEEHLRDGKCHAKFRITEHTCKQKYLLALRAVGIVWWWDKAGTHVVDTLQHKANLGPLLPGHALKLIKMLVAQICRTTWTSTFLYRLSPLHDHVVWQHTVFQNNQSNQQVHCIGH